MGILKDADDLVYPAVVQTLAALELTDKDAAAARCAERIAANIDEHTDQVYCMRWLMPELLKYLDALGATPDARARITRQPQKPGDEKPDAAVTWLDKQRAARATGRTPRS